MNEEYVPTAAGLLHLCVYIAVQMSQRSPTFSHSKRADVDIKEQVTLAAIKKVDHHWLCFL